MPEAFYVPVGPTTPRWGLFDTGRKAVVGALHFSGPEPEMGPFLALDDVRDAARAPAGTYLYVGFLHPHYGHFLLSTVSRLWMSEVRQGRLRILYHATVDISERWSGFTEQLLAPLGLRVQDFVRFDEPTIVPNLIVPCPSFVEANLAHRTYAALCRAIADEVSRGKAKTDFGSAPIYLSKHLLTSGVRRVKNEIEVTDRLSSYGVQIVSSELLSFEDRIALWRSSAPVIGFVQSAFHSSIHAEGKRVVIVSDSLSINSSYCLVDRLTGADATYLGFVDDSYENNGASIDFSMELTLKDPAECVDNLLAHLYQR